jgi:hypothetical protein
MDERVHSNRFERTPLNIPSPNQTYDAHHHQVRHHRERKYDSFPLNGQNKEKKHDSFLLNGKYDSFPAHRAFGEGGVNDRDQPTPQPMILQ